MIGRFQREEERKVRRKCFTDDMFALVHSSMKRLQHKETELSPVEIWVAATTFSSQLLELSDAEQELDYEVDDLKAECDTETDAFLIMLVACYCLIALRKQHAEVVPLVALLLNRHVKDHRLYRQLIGEIGDKEDSNWVLGKKIDLLTYEIQDVLGDTAAEKNKAVRDTLEQWLEGAKQKTGSGMEGDVLSICYINMQNGYVFDDIQRKAFEALGYKTENRPTNQFTVYPQDGSTANLGCQMQSPQFQVIPSSTEQQPKLESRSATQGDACQSKNKKGDENV